MKVDREDKQRKERIMEKVLCLLHRLDMIPKSGHGQVTFYFQNGSFVDCEVSTRIRETRRIPVKGVIV